MSTTTTTVEIPQAPSGLLDIPCDNILPNGRSVLERRYLLRNDEGKPAETIPQMFWRVASNVAAANHANVPNDITTKTSWAVKYFKEMSSLQFFPNSPTFSGAGTPLGQLAACFVLAIDDDMGKDSNEGIFSTLRTAALIQQTGGGVGFSFSRLRPKGALVHSSKGVASGPISFLRVYDTAFDAIAQGGTRRGANMAVLRVDHPDIEEFIDCKTVEGRLTNFNISVGVTEEFMCAVVADKDFDLIDPHTKRVSRTVRAKDLFNKITENAYRNGEPGILFLDTANRANPVPHLYTLESTNPCGEQFLGPYENCCLGSINLAKFADPVKHVVLWDKLAESVRTDVRFLDDVISANKYIPCIPQLRDAAHNVRRIGLGIMGLGDLAYMMRVRYGSLKCLDLVSQVAEFIRYHAMMASIDLARERGAFPAIKGSIYDPDNLVWKAPEPLQPYTNSFGRPEIDWKTVTSGILAHGIRNGAQMTVAPTGTIATVAGCEGYGCEPVFALAYTRRVKEKDGDVMLTYKSPLFEAALEEAGITGARKEAIIEKVVECGSCQGIADLPEEIRNTFVVSGDVTVEEHVLTQASLQRFVDNSISKTVNFPETAVVEDVRSAYLSAWSLGCKGLTVYVTGSRHNVVLETKSTKKNVEEKDKKAAAAAAATGSSSSVTIVSPTNSDAAAKTASALKQQEPPRSETPPTDTDGDSYDDDDDDDDDDSSTDSEKAPTPSQQQREVKPTTTRSISSFGPYLKKRPRPTHLQGVTYCADTPLGVAYITVNNTEDKEPFEVFLNVGKGGSDVSAVSESIGRLISLILRIPSLLSPSERLEHVTKQLMGIGGRKQKRMGKERVLSLPDAIAKSLREHMRNYSGEKARAKESAMVAAAAAAGITGGSSSRKESMGPTFSSGTLSDLTNMVGDLCPDCGNSTLLNIEGCKKCYICGYSEC